MQRQRSGFKSLNRKGILIIILTIIIILLLLLLLLLLLMWMWPVWKTFVVTLSMNIRIGIGIFCFDHSNWGKMFSSKSIVETFILLLVVGIIFSLAKISVDATTNSNVLWKQMEQFFLSYCFSYSEILKWESPEQFSIYLKLYWKSQDFYLNNNNNNNNNKRN